MFAIGFTGVFFDFLAGVTPFTSPPTHTFQESRGNTFTEPLRGNRFVEPSRGNSFPEGGR